MLATIYSCPARSDLYTTCNTKNTLVGFNSDSLKERDLFV